MLKGYLTTKNGYYYVVFNYFDNSSKRKTKWISSGIPEKGNNKRKAQEFLMETMEELNKKYEEKERMKHRKKDEILVSNYLKFWLHYKRGILWIPIHAMLISLWLISKKRI